MPGKNRAERFDIIYPGSREQRSALVICTVWKSDRFVADLAYDDEKATTQIPPNAKSLRCIVYSKPPDK